MYKFVPRTIVVRKTQAKVVAIISAHNQTTPFKPKARSSDPTATSYNHSQANQGLPSMVDEKESA
jgi:hypothetical protein